MTSFVEYKLDHVQLRDQHKDHCEWSPTHPVLALSVFANDCSSILLIDENGMPLIEETDESVVKKNSKVCLLSWHPTALVLAVGWESGDLGVLVVKKTDAKWRSASSTGYSMHRGVVKLEWINDGQGFFSIDISSVLMTWEFDEASGQITEKSSHQLSDQILDCLVIKSSTKNSVIYLGSASGMVFQLVFSTGSLADVLALESGVKKMLYYSRKNRLVVFTEAMFLCQFALSSSGEATEVSKVKLSGHSRSGTIESLTAMMIDESTGLIGISLSGERAIRLWQLESGNNAAVVIAESSDSHWSGITSIDYRNRILAAGTSNNHVTVWKKTSGADFVRVSQVQVRAAVIKVSVSPNHQIACLTTANDVYIIDEQNMCFAASNMIAVVQTSANQVKIKSFNNNILKEIKLEVPVKNVIIEPSAKLIGIKTINSKEIEFYLYNKRIGTINSTASMDVNEYNNMLVLSDEVAWTVALENEENSWRLHLVSNQIQTKKRETHQVELIIDASAGKRNDSVLVKVVTLVINKQHMLMVIQIDHKYYYYIYQVEGPKLTLKSGPTRLEGKEVTTAHINCDGSMVACDDDKRLMVVAVSQEKSQRHFNYSTESGADIEKICWADNESRLLCFYQDNTITIMLCSLQEEIIRPYDQLSVEGDSRLISLVVPNVYLLKGEEIIKRNLNGLDGLTSDTTSIFIDFLTSKDIDMNQMIKRINESGQTNDKLWNSLAQLSVKNRDVDMGIYCCSKLQDARTVGDVRKELAEHGKEAACAVLAMNLGMTDEAEDILKKSQQPSLLAKFYQGMNDWNKAIDSVDKINEKSVYYNYAKHLEHDDFDVQQAIKFYEKSATHIFEVPRMLFDVEGNAMLRTYCLGENQHLKPEDRLYLIRWWGQYSESLGDVQEALSAYELAKDYYNSVRLLCYVGETDKAKTMVNGIINDQSTEDNPTRNAAMLHLGRHLEESYPVESITYYLSSGAIKHAIRVCKSNGLVNELIKLTINYGSEVEARDLVAKYVDTKDQDISEDLLVQLYYKCGYLDQAIASALKTRTLNRLRELLTSEMVKVESGHKVDIRLTPETIKLVLEALKHDSELIDIVIDLLLLSKSDRQSELIQQLVIEYNISINDQLIERVEKIVKIQENGELMSCLADLALQQGQFLTAAKLYNNRGMRTDAVKALIRTGVTDKVVNFANIARDKSVYRIAANYLETVGYEDEKLIATFVRKGGGQTMERMGKRNYHGES